MPGLDPRRDDLAAEGSSFSEPDGHLTLQDALVAALTNSPKLAAYSWEARAREAEALQAGFRPNPEFGTELENFGGSGDSGGFENAEATIALSQLIELGGKRGKRQALAAQEQNLAAWEYEEARIDVLTDVTKAFFEVIGAQEQLELADDFVEVAEGVLASVARRVEAGSASSVEKSRAQVELESSRIERDRAQRGLSAARTLLSEAWGGEKPLFSDAIGDIELILQPPSYQDLTVGIDKSPAVARGAIALDHSRASLELERSMGIPDLSLGGGVRYSRDSEDAALVFEFELPLPLSDRNQGNSMAAAMRLRKAEEETRAIAIRLQAQLAMLHEDLLSADTEARALRDRALPEALTAFRAAREAYQRGSMRFTDVLDTERMLFELKSRYHDALIRHHGAVAEIERLLGEPMTSFRDDTGRP